MRILIQRVMEAEVNVNSKIVGKAGKGYLLFVGFSEEDTEKELHDMAEKILNLRIFEDSLGKMNHSIRDISGDILSISQFTLYGDVRKGRRPSFTQAAKPEKALKLYDAFNEILKKSELSVETGIFGGDMKVSLINDGPVTIFIDSNKTF